MKFLRHLLIIFPIFVCINIIFPSKAYAYLDPGAGSYILQLIVGLTAGALFLLKRFWLQITDKIKSLFFKKKNNNS